jgi:hypothetical protein|tara:strand:+ start:11226 stop:11489 length:264 start_codon:yes stop_codon:yes gene_type:complete
VSNKKVLLTGGARLVEKILTKSLNEKYALSILDQKEIDDIKYETFYATSNNYLKIWSIDKAKKTLGYIPKDSVPSSFTLRKIRDEDK